MSRRTYDLVLVGATGIAGRLTAAHLARYAPPGLRVALAGRSRERLAAVRDDLGGTAADWPLVVVDVGDDAAVADLAAATRVVVTTVGPYLRYGLPLVRACAEAGTHYADLTGETLFVRRSIDQVSQRAKETGARIVHSCGFDSVPSDLGVGLTAARAEADGAGTLAETVLHVRSIKAGVSGSTIDSLRQQLLEVKDDAAARSLVGRSDALVDEPPAFRVRGGRRPPAARRDPVTGVWQTPFVMGPFNAQIVRRSEDLRHRPYGVGFSYAEVLDTGRGASGAASAVAVSVVIAALMAGLWFGPTRTLLDRVLPDPGVGPSDEVLAKGRFLVEVRATTSTGARYQTSVGADKDPGYRGTAVMLGESGLSLAVDALPDRAGVLTPMVAFGSVLADRLRAQDFTVRTERL